MPTNPYVFFKLAAIHLDNQTNLDHIESWININQLFSQQRKKQA
jgi:hypothetical protein